MIIHFLQWKNSEKFFECFNTPMLLSVTIFSFMQSNTPSYDNLHSLKSIFWYQQNKYKEETLNAKTIKL